MIRIRDNQYEARNIKFNKSVCCNKYGYEAVVAIRDTIFGKFIDFTEDVASMLLFPFPVRYLPPMRGDEVTQYSVLTTALDPLGAAGVHNFYEIDPKYRYLNFGQKYIEPHFNNFADYKGYTYIKVFLPFVGYVDVDVNECMGKWLQFRLVVDYFTGKGLFIIGVSDERVVHPQLVYSTEADDVNVRVISTFECNVAIEIPIGSSNAADIKRNLLMGAVKVGVGIGAAVYTAGLAPATTTTSSVTTYDIHGKSLKKGSRAKKIKFGTETTEKTTTHHTPVNKSKIVSEAVDGSIDVLNRLVMDNSCDRVNDSELMWGISTVIEVLIYRPKFAPVSSEYSKLYGYPLGDVYQLNDLSGYTEINAIHFEGDGFRNMLNKEAAMLEELFSNGIIL